MRNLYINNGTLVENTRTRISIGSIGKFFFGPFYSIIMQLFPTKSVSFSFPYIYCSQHQLLFFPISLNFTPINFLNYSKGGGAFLPCSPLHNNFNMTITHYRYPTFHLLHCIFNLSIPIHIQISFTVIKILPSEVKPP